MKKKTIAFSLLCLTLAVAKLGSQVTTNPSVIGPTVVVVNGSDPSGVDIKGAPSGRQMSGGNYLPNGGYRDHALVVYHDHLWLLGGKEGATNGGVAHRVVISNDGITWAERGTDAFSVNTGETRAAVWKDQVWALTNGRVYSSSDGLTWTQRSTQPAGNSNGTTLTSFNGYLWLIGSAGIGTRAKKIYRSVDGAVWSEVGSDVLASLSGQGIAYPAVTVHDGKIWIIGGYDADKVRTEVLASSDGVNWTKISDLPVDLWGSQVLSLGGKLWVVNGSRANFVLLNGIYSSSDGVTWTGVGNGLVASAVHAAAVFNGSIVSTGGWVPSGNGITLNVQASEQKFFWPTTFTRAIAPFYSSEASSVLTISTNTIAPTNTVHHLGAGLVKTITVPAACFPTCSISIVPDAAFTTDTTGNVGLASTATIGRLMIFAWDGTKWWPSY